MTNYLIESSICLAGFYSFYWIFLHREKLLSINRFYLLITSALSLTIPLLDFKYTPDTTAPAGNFSPQIPAGSETLFGLEGIPIQGIYLAGLTLSIIFFAIRLFKAKKHLSEHSSLYKKQAAIVEIPGNEAYSFFNTIFIGKDLAQNADLRAQILAHETAHIKEFHFIDLIYFELVKCLFWFNPFPYLYSKSIKLQHEYIADHRALKKTTVETYEQSLLRFTLSKIDNSLIAAFGQHPIQQRLKMIYKLNSNIMNKLKPVLCLPILAILFVSFACSEDVATESDITPEEVISEIPIDGTVIEVEEMPVVTGSFVYDENAVFIEEEVPVVTNISIYEGRELHEVEVVVEGQANKSYTYSNEAIEFVEEEIPVDKSGNILKEKPVLHKLKHIDKPVKKN